MIGVTVRLGHGLGVDGREILKHTCRDRHDTLLDRSQRYEKHPTHESSKNKRALCSLDHFRWGLFPTLKACGVAVVIVVAAVATLQAKTTSQLQDEWASICFLFIGRPRLTDQKCTNAVRVRRGAVHGLDTQLRAASSGPPKRPWHTRRGRTAKLI